MISFDVRVVGEEVLVRLDQFPAWLQQVLQEKMSVLTEALRTKVAENLSGKVLQTKTGTLLSSLVAGTERQGDLLIGFVAVEPPSDAVKAYALAHEYGGKSAYTIAVGKAGVLANRETGFFSKHDVVHPPAQERSYLRSALRDEEPFVVAGLEEAIQEAIEGGL